MTAAGGMVEGTTLNASALGPYIEVDLSAFRVIPKTLGNLALREPQNSLRLKPLVTHTGTKHLQYGAKTAMNGKRVGLYLRVSTGEQSIETQHMGLVAACEARALAGTGGTGPPRP